MDEPTVEEPLLAVRRGGDGEDGAMASTAAEVKRLLRLAGPLMAGFVLRNSVQMVSVMFVGHLGELQLAGSSLAASLANVTGFSFLFGMSSALDTLCGQAYGAGQHRLLGVYAQRAMLVLAAAAVPIALVWASAGEILLLFGQDPAIAAEAGAYARWMIPSLAAYVPLACALRFLQAQGIVVPVMASSGVAAVAHVAVCWALVHKAGMGSKGAALSGAVTYWTNFAVLAFYARLSGACKATWTGFSMDAFRELRRFTELAVPSAMMVCLEWSSFEILVLLSGILPNPQLETAVLSISLSTASLLIMVPRGIGSSLSTRVSNELGGGHPRAARMAARVATAMTVLVCLVLVIAMILLRNVWGYTYSSEEEVVAYIASMLPILAVSFFVDGINGALSGYHGKRKGLQFKSSNSMKNSRNVGVVFSNEDVFNVIGAMCAATWKSERRTRQGPTPYAHRGDKSMLKRLIHGFYAAAIVRLPVDEMPALLPAILDSNLYFGPLDPISNIVTNVVSRLPPAANVMASAVAESPCGVLDQLLPLHAHPRGVALPARHRGGSCHRPPHRGRLLHAHIRRRLGHYQDHPPLHYGGPRATPTWTALPWPCLHHCRNSG
uniref:Protein DETOXIFICATION n=1 Tax=Oryza glumipatula TaxID=40148 RepID=A0A0E0B998_9ORYZ